MNQKPFLIQFPRIGKTRLGYISVAEKESLPFVPKRIYWTYFTPENVERGGHAHLELEQILVAVSGRVELTVETKQEEIFHFKLEDPSVGAYIPKMSWRIMKYSHNAVQMCIASLEYDENDYIRHYEDFLLRK